jgi:hypothetical protein
MKSSKYENLKLLPKNFILEIATDQFDLIKLLLWLPPESFARRLWGNRHFLPRL